PYCPTFFFTALFTANIYSLSLHDALPIWCLRRRALAQGRFMDGGGAQALRRAAARRGALDPDAGDAGARRDARLGGTASSSTPKDRKSTRLNSSHVEISYAVFCLKKKKIL